MRTIILTKGVPASGKSTWAREEMQAHPNKYKRVNKDLLREMLDWDVHDMTKEKFLLDVRDYVVERALCRGFDVIIDDTNFSNKHFEAMCAIARRIGDVRVFEKYFDVTLKEALERNVKRPKPVPDAAIVEMFKKHIKGLQCHDEYFPIEPKESRRLAVTQKPKAIIVDIDGTLALNEGNRSNYDNSRVGEDRVYEDIALLVSDLAKNFTVIVVSGREDTCRGITEDWLNRFMVPYKELHMRKAGDFRPDYVIKKEIYDTLIDPLYHVVYVIDDRRQVVRMWRSLKLTVLQVDDLPF